METDKHVRLHLAWLKRRNLQPNTAIHRKGQLARLTAYLQIPLIDATQDDLERWQLSLRVCASSVMTYTSHVRAFYDWAHHAGHIDTNPALELVMPKIKQRLPRPIPEDDLRIALATASHNHVMFCWLLLAGYCGLRAGEIAVVTRGDFRPDDHGGAYLVVNGKGGHQRIVRVPTEVLAELAQFMQQTGPIFRRRNGQPFTPNYLSQLAAKHLKAIGLNYTLHTLRHRFATRLCDLGADVRDVQQLLGHRNLATTTLYVAHDTRRSSASVDKLGAGLSAMTKRQRVTRS